MSADNREYSVGIKLRVDADEAGKLSAHAAVVDDVKNSYAAATVAQRGYSEAVAESTADVSKLLDKYDPLGKRLRELQGDFKALSVAARTGALGENDDARTDAVYARLKNEIRASEAALKQFGHAHVGVSTEVEKGTSSMLFGTREMQRHLMVLGQEAVSGNYARMPNTLMSVARSAISAGGGIAAVVGPVALMAGAFAVALKTMNDVTAEQREMNSALQLTSGYAGQTRGSMLALADSIEATTSMSIGQSKTLVTQLVASGRIGSEAIVNVGRLAEDYAAATGRDVAQIAPQLVSLFADPAKGAEELNRQMHFLSVSEMAHIRNLQETGQLEEAQLALSEKLSAHLPRHADNLGILESAWSGVRRAASSAWDAMLGIGREKTLEEKVGSLNHRLSGMADQYGINTKDDPAKWATALREKISGTVLAGSVGADLDEFDALRAQQNRAAEQTAAASKAAEENRKNHAATTLAGRYSGDTEIQRLKNERVNILENMRPELASTIDEQERLITVKNNALLALDKKIDEAINGKAKKPRATGGATVDKQEYDIAKQQLENAQKLSVEQWRGYNAALESQHKQGIISDHQLIAARTQANVEQLEAQRTRLQAEFAAASTLAQTLSKPAERQKARLDAEKLGGEIVAVNQKIGNELEAAANQHAEVMKKTAEAQMAWQIDATKRRGDLVLAAEAEFQKQYGETLAAAEKDMASSNQAIAAQAEKTVEALGGVKKAMLEDGNWSQLKQQYDDLFGEMEFRLERVRAVAERDGGVLAGMQAGAAEQAIRAELLPQLEALRIKLGQVAGVSDSIALKRSMVELSRQQQKAAEEIPAYYKKNIDTADGYFRDGFSKMLSDTKGGWDSWTKSLGNTFLGMIGDIAYQMTLHPIVVSVMQQVLAPGSTGATGQAGSGGGILNLVQQGSQVYNAAGSVWDGISSAAGWLGIGGGSTVAAGAGAAASAAAGAAASAGAAATTAASAAASAGAAASAVGAGAGAAAGGSSLAGIGAALGPVGVVLGVGMLAASLLGKKRGGPKKGGSYTGNWSADGSLMSENDWRSFTPSEEDDVAKTLVTTAYAGIIKAARRQGERLDGLALNIGFDSDPQGTAPNRVSTEARVGGVSIFDSYQQLGRDGALYEKERQLSPARLTLQLADGLTALGISVAGVDSQVWATVAAAEGFEKLGAGMQVLASVGVPAFNQAIFDNAGALADARAEFEQSGQAIPATAAAYVAVVKGLDLTTEAGRNTAAALISAAPAWKKYQEALEAQGKLFTGLDKAGLAQSGANAVMNADSAKSAGEAWGKSFAQSFAQNATNILFTSISDLIYNAVVQPVANNVIAASSNLAAGGIAASTSLATGGTMSGTAVATGGMIAGQALADAVAQARELIAVYAAVMSDAGVQSALTDAQNALKDLGGAAWTAIAPVYIGGATPAADKADNVDKTSADRAKELLDFLADLDRQLAAFGLGDAAARLREIQVDTDAGLAKLAELAGATDENIAKLQRLASLQNAAVLKDLTAGWRQATLSPNDLAGYDTQALGKQFAAAWVALAQTVNVDPTALAQVAYADGRDLTAIGAQYWETMDHAQREALATVLETRTRYVAAIKSMMDTQVQAIDNLYGSLKSVRGFGNDLRKDIAGIRITAGSLDKSAWYDQELTRAKDEVASLQAMGGTPDELLAGYQEVRDLIQQRWQLDYEGVTRQIQFTRSLREYLDSLKVSDQAPASVRARLTEAASQFRVTADQAATGDEDAMRQWRTKADAYLGLGRDMYASGSGYTAIYNEVMARGEATAAIQSVEEATLAEQRLIAAHAASAVSELQSLQTATGHLESTVSGKLTSAIGELNRLGGISTALGADGAIAQAIANLPTELMAMINGGGKITVGGTGGGTGSGGRSSGLSAAETNFVGEFGRNWNDSLMRSPDYQAITTWGKDQLAAGDFMSIYNAAHEADIPMIQVDAMLNLPRGTSANWADSAGLPKFDSGADYIPFDMPAIVHAGERIITRTGNAELVDAVRTLVSIAEHQAVEIAELRQAVDRLTQATVDVTLDAADIIVEGHGQVLQNVEYARQSQAAAMVLV